MSIICRITVGSCVDGLRQAVSALPALNFDLVLMDIHLTDGSSFDVLDKVNLTQPIIFITAYNKYVLQAFKHLSVEADPKLELFTSIDRMSKFKQWMR